MPERQGVIDRIKGTEREYEVAVAAIGHYRQAIQDDPAQLRPDIATRDLVAMAEGAESTYLIRIWAEFETGLRSYRRRITGNFGDKIRARDLIDWTAGIKQGRAISVDVRDRAHEVRQYRNFLLHQRDDREPPPVVTIREARKRLNTPCHCLPIQW